MSDSKRLDLAHLIRIQAVLDGIPGGTDLPYAIIVLEDALTCLRLAFQCAVPLERAREIHRQSVTREETRCLLAEHREKQ